MPATTATRRVAQAQAACADALARNRNWQAGWDDYHAGSDYADRPAPDAARHYRRGWDAAARNAGVAPYG